MKKCHKITCSRWILLCLLALAPFIGDAQNPGGYTNFRGKVRYGGGVGLGFGNENFNAQLAPSALYQANDYLGFGLGLNFNYARFGDARLTAYGGSLLSLFNPLPRLQLSVEFEELRVHRDFGDGLPNARDNYWLPALFTGLGYSSGPVTFGIRYDLLYREDKSIYADPWMPFVRFYF